MGRSVITGHDSIFPEGVPGAGMTGRPASAAAMIGAQA